MSGGEGLTKKRNASFELLRIIAMLMIIVLHYNIHSDSLLKLGEPATGVQLFAAGLIRAGCHAPIGAPFQPARFKAGCGGALYFQRMENEREGSR